jgi:uncharacterized protein involved in propanediol utilization
VCRCILFLCKARWRDPPLERPLSAFSGMCLLLRARVLEWELAVVARERSVVGEHVGVGVECGVGVRAERVGTQAERFGGGGERAAVREEGAGAGAERTGVGVAGRHHGEILQGAVRRDGELLPCLITMPLCGAGSAARYVSAETSEGWPLGSPGSTCRVAALDVVPAWKRKAEKAARLALAFIGAPAGGRLEIECSVATGVGLGSSTCDVVAAIRAVCGFHGVTLDACDVARLAVEAEGACDPLMFDGEMVLFAQRHGRVLESFGRWVPRYTLLSIDTDEGDRGIDTLGLPLPDYTHAELTAFEDMLRRARAAFTSCDLAAIGAIATESATVNQRFLPLRQFRAIRELADEYRALGVQISHSGTVAGVLFDAARSIASDSDLSAQLAARVRSLGLRPLGLFTTGN